jgi:hypothetical protein
MDGAREDETLRLSDTLRRNGTIWASLLLTVSAVRTSGATAEATTTALATIAVSSEPAGAQVRCDGVARGATPIELSVPPGEHRISVLKDGYLENSRTVTLAAGEAQSFHVALTAAGAPTEAQGAAPRAKAAGDEGESGVAKKSRKRIYIAAGAAVLAVGGGLTYALTRNGAPETGTVSVSPASGMSRATSFRFTATARDDGGAAQLAYAWDFGDGATATEPSPAHVYESPGNYTVRLTVRDRKGKSSAPATVGVTVVRGLAGTWAGRVPGVGNPATIVLTQSDTTLSGTLSWGQPADERATVWCAGTCTGPLAGQASNAYPADVTFSADVLGIRYSFTGSSADGNALVGTSSWEWPGSVGGGGATTFTRQ